MTHGFLNNQSGSRNGCGSTKRPTRRPRSIRQRGRTNDRGVPGTPPRLISASVAVGNFVDITASSRHRGRPQVRQGGMAFMQYEQAVCGADAQGQFRQPSPSGPKWFPRGPLCAESRPVLMARG